MLVICDNCEKEFDKTLYKIKRSKKHFCSKKCMGEFNRADLVGQFFEEWEVLEFDCVKTYPSGRQHIKFKCKCSCGRIFSIPSGALLRGDSKKCKNCAGREYVGEISGEYFCSVKLGAKNRNIYFEITKEDIWNQFLKQDRKCILSSIELTWQDGHNGKLGTASVDRINSETGYIKDNIQIIHKDINWMKNNFDQDYFLELCKAIAYNKENKMSTELIEKDITTELYREYDFGGRVYRIDNPQKLFYRTGGTTHRVVGADGVVHCVPVPGAEGCVLRWVNKDKSNPVEF